MLKLLDYEQGVTILVGNKTDLPNRQVTEEEAQNWANEKKIPYVEISCKENDNDVILFSTIILLFLFISRDFFLLFFIILLFIIIYPHQVFTVLTTLVITLFDKMNGIEYSQTMNVKRARH